MRTTKEDVLIQKQTIVDAAFEAFSSRGYDTVKLDDIAEQIGISRSPLYYHFGSKYKLFVEVIDNYSRALVQKYRNIYSMPIDIFDKIEKGISLSISEETKPFGRLFSEAQTLGKKNPELSQKIDDYLMTLVDIKASAVGQAIAEGRIKAGTDPQFLVKQTFYFFYGIESIISMQQPYWASLDHQLAIKSFIHMLRMEYET